MTNAEFVAYCQARDECPRKTILETPEGPVAELSFRDGTAFFYLEDDHIVEVTGRQEVTGVLVRHRLQEPMN